MNAIGPRAVRAARPLSAALCLLVAACGMNPNGPPVTGAKPTAGEELDQVLLRIKQEIGLFMVNSRDWHKNYRADLAKAGIKPACGSGDINFNIKSVNMEFATIADNSRGGGVGLAIPFAGGLGGIGPSASITSESKGTNTLDYTYYPTDANQRIGDIPDVVRENAIIEPTLKALRDAIMKATAQRPCMSDTPRDMDNTFVFGVELTQSTNEKLGFNFAIANANLSADQSNTRSNTITVTFHPTATGGQLLAK
jgi:hypothetical protein